MDTSSTPLAVRPSPHRTGREQVWLALVFLAAALLLSWSLWNGHRQVDAAERARLDALAGTVQQNLARQLEGVDAALRGVRTDMVGWPPQQRWDIAHERMKGLCDAMPGVRSMHVVGVDGIVLASSVRSLVGGNVTQREFFQQVRAQPLIDRLYVSQPFLTATGIYSMNVSVALLGSGGEFAGLISATLDPEYFDTVLASALYASDMRGIVAHGSGDVLLAHPISPRVQAMGVARPDSFFGRHLQSGRQASVLTGANIVDGRERLSALRTLQPPGLKMDQPLVLSLSRDLEAVFASWQRQARIDALVFVLCALAAWTTLRALQRRREQLEDLARRTAAQHAADAERVSLALRGGDLALWDAHLPTRQGVVNERWYSMLGYAPSEIAADDSGWRALVHPDDVDRVIAAQEAHIAGHTEGYEAIYRLRHREGHWVWVLDRARVVERDAQGQAVRMVGTHMDITQRMLSEEALRRSEESLAITLHSIGDAVIATDPQGIVTRLNATAERLTGWPAAEALGQPLAALFRIYNARTREPVPDPVALVLEREQIVGLANDTVLVARDGSEHPIADSAAPIRAASGEVLGVVLVFSDVTEHYRMLQALRGREAQLSALAAALPGPVARLDRDGRYVFANSTCERWFGRPLAELLGHHWRELYPPEVQAQIEDPIVRALAGEASTFDATLPSLAGPREVMLGLVPDQAEDGSVQGCYVVVTDISERKRAEEEARLSEDRLRMASRMARLGGWRRDLVSGETTLSPELIAMMELEPGHRPVTGGGMDFIAPAYRERLRALIDACTGDGQAFDIEVPAQTRRGRPLQLRLLGEAVRDSAGRIVALQGAAQDVTESRQAQQQLRLLEAAVARLNDVVLITEADPLDEPGPRIVFVNEAFERLTGYSCTEAIGRSPRFLQGALTSRAELDRMRDALQRQQPVRVELANYKRDGTLFWVDIEIMPLAAADGQVRHLVAVQRDITERRQLEGERLVLDQRLREAQKMDSIGTLAGGIAHDFNNILPAILGNVALARADLPPAHPVQLSLDQINMAALRARSLVQQILTFSRRQSDSLQVQPLRPVVEETLALLRATLPAVVRLDTQLAEESVVVEADATQLQQVLMNLCTNAWHALPEGRGRIEVGLRGLDAEAVAGLKLDQVQPGPMAQLWVADNGCGMDAATTARIFDPFFTTKPVGQGTGLGLSVVHGIVRAHRGAIQVQSTPGAGSRFDVYLPLQPMPDSSRAKHRSGLPETQGAGEQLLYVDDDEVMVMLVQRLLERAGYGVTACSTVAAALAEVEADPERFSLVISDFNMPEMSGMDLVQALARLRPELPVIITSGYLTDALRQQARAAGVKALLRKENTLERLPGLVQEVLTQAGGGAPEANS